MKHEVFWRNRLWPPTFFCQPDPMLTSNSSTPSNDLFEQRVQSLIHPLMVFGLLRIGHHHVDMNVTVAGMAKTGDREPGSLLQVCRKFYQINETAARHGHILVQLSQSSRFERFRESAPQVPQRLAFGLAKCGVDA